MKALGKANPRIVCCLCQSQLAERIGQQQVHTFFATKTVQTQAVVFVWATKNGVLVQSEFRILESLQPPANQQTQQQKKPTSTSFNVKKNQTAWKTTVNKPMFDESCGFQHLPKTGKLEEKKLAVDLTRGVRRRRKKENKQKKRGGRKNGKHRLGAFLRGASS